MEQFFFDLEKYFRKNKVLLSVVRRLKLYLPKLQFPTAAPPDARRSHLIWPKLQFPTFLNSILGIFSLDDACRQK